MAKRLINEYKLLLAVVLERRPDHVDLIHLLEDAIYALSEGNCAKELIESINRECKSL